MKQELKAFAEATSRSASWAIVTTLAITQVRWEPWQGPEEGVTCSDLTHSHPVLPMGNGGTERLTDVPESHS